MPPLHWPFYLGISLALIGMVACLAAVRAAEPLDLPADTIGIVLRVSLGLIILGGLLLIIGLLPRKRPPS